ncbi:putative porin [Endomicrobium proavitum]|uniref:Porin n=1 Tax=Endomicrobium proavitum TaxID=1408281 RepID=A0A0G3WLP2_9BACT|nr:putative porin [Endomicrobium proavitum]AKL98419.1 conserved exported protein of unknown function [Endomicrobium proavitum]
MKKVFLLAAACVIAFTQAVNASEIDGLVNKLVEKGIISAGEGRQIITETNEDVKSLTAAGSQAGVPQWVQNLKFSGDVRLRHQMDWTATGTRNRERIRLRFAVETRVIENMKAAFGLATGSTANGEDLNPTSANFTVRAFNKAPIFVDHAYLSYNIDGVGQINVGKIKSGLVTWNLRQLIWKSDVNPDGASFNTEGNIGSGFGYFGNIAWLTLNGDVRFGADMPDVYIAQPGVTYKNGNVSVKAAVGYQQFNTRGRIGYPSNNAATAFANISNETGKYLGSSTTYTNETNFQLLNPSIEIKVKEVVGKYGFSLFCEYSKNLNDSVYKGANEAGLYGFGLGDDKVANFGDWTLSVASRFIKATAIPFGLGNTDVYEGQPDVKGYEASFAFGLTKNTSLGINYFNYRRITGANREQSLAQAELNYKF